MFHGWVLGEKMWDVGFEARCLTSYAWIFGISSSSWWLGMKTCEESWEDGAVGKMIRTQALGLLNPFLPALGKGRGHKVQNSKAAQNCPTTKPFY